MNNYLSLHLHTIKSIGDSIVTIEKLINKAKELKLNALSITNHGTMSDTFEFYSACKEENIKPIIGCEIYARSDEDEHKYNHLVLIAKNNKGYRNLLKIHNYGQLQGFYRKPLVDDWVLKAYGNDIICLSACVGGAIPQAILKAENHPEESDEYSNYIINKINNYKSYFDEFYLEIQPGDFKEQTIVNNYLKIFSEMTNTPMVITNDVHYIDKEDYKVHNVHVVADRKNADVTKLVYPDTCYYVMSTDEIRSAINIEEDLFNSCMANIQHIVDQVEDYNIISGKINMPKYDVPLGYTEDEYLEKICFDRLSELTLKIKDPAEYTSRLIYELNTIKELNFSGYFLVVKDYIDFARSKDIEVGPGRGSVCGLT